MTRRKPLSTIVADSLVAKIGAGQLRPGDKIPTEAELCAEYEVSRTVVREAIARLRSEGLVVPHQGRGMFVGEPSGVRSFSIPDEALKTLPETLALLELRLSVEVEAAGLCAERCTASEAFEIRSLMEKFDAQQEDPETVNIHYDYDFHLAIAKAAQNEFMHAFLIYLRPKIVARYQLGYVVTSALKDKYYSRIHKEHNAIVEAIERRDAQAARRAMRKHLHNSLERVRELAPDSRSEQPDPESQSIAARLFDEFGRSLASER